MKKGRVVVFISGRGSNFVALYRSSQRADSNYTIAAVLSDRGRAPGLKKASRLGVPCAHVPPRSFPTREAYESELVRLCREHRADLICLAGYLRIVGPTLLSAFGGRILNIHPALLPSFPGLHAQKQALDHGVKVSGCSVHFVDSGTDTGPIVLQKAVPVKEGDSEESLSRRILRQEHRLYPQAVRLYFEGRLRIENRRVIILAR